MRSTKRTRRAAMAAAGTVAVVAMVANGSTVGASGAGGPMRDGNWTGTMTVGATVDFSSGGTAVIAQGDGNGTFDLILAGGAGLGDFTWSGESSSALEGDGVSGHANAIFVVTGTMEGIATGPILRPMSATADVTGVVNSGGIEVPFNVPLDFGPDELTSSTLHISASSCTTASGTWAQEFKEAVEAAGGAVTSFQGSWAATYTGEVPGATDAVLDEMLARGEAIFTQWLSTGTFDALAMEEVLIDAEHFAASGPTTDGCDSASTGAWASPLSGMVERLLTAMANSPSTTPEAFRFGIAAGLRTNTLPSVPPDTLEASLMTKAQSMLDAAIAANDTFAMLMIGVSADSMGWTDISAAAAAAAGG